MNIEIQKFSTDADYKNAKNILVIGVVHGDEPYGEYFIENYIKNKRKLKNNLYYIKRLNSENTRKNKNGVDINRNFPTKNWILSDKNEEYFGGYSPNSETETKAITSLMDRVKFDLILTIHAPYKIVNFDPDNTQTREIAQTISNILSYPVQSDIGYPTPGSFGTYAGIERNIPTITIETEENPDKEKLYKKFEKLFDYIENIF